MMNTKQSIQALFLATTLCLTANVSAFAQGSARQTTQRVAARVSAPVPPSMPNQLLVMVHKGADKDEVNEILKTANGRIINTISNGTLLCLVIEVPTNKLEEDLKTFSKDKHFDAVQRNMLSAPQAHTSPSSSSTNSTSPSRTFPNSTPNDPSYSQQYQLPMMNVSSAWAQGGSGSGVVIGVIDTGVIGSEKDLAGKVDTGYNEVKKANGGNSDQTTGTNPFYHGTFVSTCSAGLTNNNVLGASPAYAASIIPVNVFDQNATTTDADIMNALFYLEGRGVKLVNLSINCSVPYTFANASAHSALSQAFADFYTNHNGLLFNAAGNDGKQDTSAMSAGLICISSVNSSSKLSSFSNYGSPIWFAAPGENVISGSGTNGNATASGTSFACPLAMSVAAQIWGVRPKLTNTQVLTIMSNTTTKPAGYTTSQFGYGIVNAGAAVAKALTY